MEKPVEAINNYSVKKMDKSKYEDVLNKIDFYKVHPELKPYIGGNYDRFKILLVGESHYIRGECEKAEVYEKDGVEPNKAKEFSKSGKWNKVFCDINWYTSKIPQESIAFDYKSWFDTRHIISNYLNRKRYKSYSIYRNPANTFCEYVNETKSDVLDDSVAFTYFAFINYFQRPCHKSGETFEKMDGLNDYNKSKEIFEKAVEAIDPTYIIFLSKAAYKKYINENSPSKICKRTYYEVCHPSCKLWNEEKNNFKKILSGIMENSKTNFAYEKIEMCISNREKIASIVTKSLSSANIEVVDKCYQKAVYTEGKVTIKIKTEKESKFIDEISLHHIKGNNKLSAYYDITHKILREWNYDKNDFVEEEKESDVCRTFRKLICSESFWGALV